MAAELSTIAMKKCRLVCRWWKQFLQPYFVDALYGNVIAAQYAIRNQQIAVIEKYFKTDRPKNRFRNILRRLPDEFLNVIESMNDTIRLSKNRLLARHLRNLKHSAICQVFQRKHIQQLYLKDFAKAGFKIFISVVQTKVRSMSSFA